MKIILSIFLFLHIILFAETTDNIKEIAYANFKKLSSKQNNDHRYLPPWEKAEINNIFYFLNKPLDNENATLIPLGVDIEPFELKIVSSEKMDIEDATFDWWDVEFEYIYDKSILNNKQKSDIHKDSIDQYPFDVAVIYPAIKNAKQIKKDRYNKGTYLNNEVYIDVDNDKIEDIKILHYSCTPGSEYMCSKTSIKKKGKWIVLYSSKPM